MSRGSRTESSWGSARIGASQHVEDCLDQLGAGAVIVVSVGVANGVHDTILIAESDLGPQQKVGWWLGRLCPDLRLEFTCLLLNAGEGCIRLIVVVRQSGWLYPSISATIFRYARC